MLLLACLSMAVIKHSDQSHLGEKGVSLAYTFRSQSIIEEGQSRNSNQDLDAETEEEGAC